MKKLMIWIMIWIFEYAGIVQAGPTAKQALSYKYPTPDDPAYINSARPHLDLYRSMVFDAVGFAITKTSVGWDQWSPDLKTPILQIIQNLFALSGVAAGEKCSNRYVPEKLMNEFGFAFHPFATVQDLLNADLATGSIGIATVETTLAPPASVSSPATDGFWMAAAAPHTASKMTLLPRKHHTTHFSSVNESFSLSTTTIKRQTFTTSSRVASRSSVSEDLGVMTINGISFNKTKVTKTGNIGCPWDPLLVAFAQFLYKLNQEWNKTSGDLSDDETLCAIGGEVMRTQLQTQGFATSVPAGKYQGVWSKETSKTAALYVLSSNWHRDYLTLKTWLQSTETPRSFGSDDSKNLKHRDAALVGLLPLLAMSPFTIPNEMLQHAIGKDRLVAVILSWIRTVAPWNKKILAPYTFVFDNGVPIPVCVPKDQYWLTYTILDSSADAWPYINVPDYSQGNTASSSSEATNHIKGVFYGGGNYNQLTGQTYSSNFILPSRPLASASNVEQVAGNSFLIAQPQQQLQALDSHEKHKLEDKQIGFAVMDIGLAVVGAFLPEIFGALVGFIRSIGTELSTAMEAGDVVLDVLDNVGDVIGGSVCSLEFLSFGEDNSCIFLSEATTDVEATASDANSLQKTIQGSLKSKTFSQFVTSTSLSGDGVAAKGIESVVTTTENILSKLGVTETNVYMPVRTVSSITSDLTTPVGVSQSSFFSAAMGGNGLTYQEFVQQTLLESLQQMPNSALAAINVSDGLAQEVPILKTIVQLAKNLGGVADNVYYSSEVNELLAVTSESQTIFSAFVSPVTISSDSLNFASGVTSSIKQTTQNILSQMGINGADIQIPACEANTIVEAANDIGGVGKSYITGASGGASSTYQQTVAATLVNTLKDVETVSSVSIPANVAMDTPILRPILGLSRALAGGGGGLESLADVDVASTFAQYISTVAQKFLTATESIPLWVNTLDRLVVAAAVDIGPILATVKTARAYRKVK